MAHDIHWNNPRNYTQKLIVLPISWCWVLDCDHDDGAYERWATWIVRTNCCSNAHYYIFVCNHFYMYSEYKIYGQRFQFVKHMQIDARRSYSISGSLMHDSTSSCKIEVTSESVMHACIQTLKGEKTVMHVLLLPAIVNVLSVCMHFKVNWALHWFQLHVPQLKSRLPCGMPAAACSLFRQSRSQYCCVQWSAFDIVM